MRKILCLCLVLTICVCLCSCKSSDYKKAMALYEAGEYEQAMAAFEALGDYQDSAAKIEECEIEIAYMDAVALMEANQFEEAIAAFEALDGYKDSLTRIEDCNTAIMDVKYKDAVALMDTDLVQAFEALIALDGYKDSAEKADSIYEQYAMEKIKAANVGDYIPFGRYEQDNNRINGKEYVEWLVLDKKDDKLLLISRYGLDCQEYNDNLLKRVTWQTCSLREWLNGTFVYGAFSSNEQSMITKTGQDKVFLLSYGEVYNYFNSTGTTRECKPTDYAISRGAYVDSDSGICRWWVRGDDYTNEHRAIFQDNSIVSRKMKEWGEGVQTFYHDFSVRPALWIKIDP